MTTSNLFDRTPLFEYLREHQLEKWALQLEGLCCERYQPTAHGLMSSWIEAILRLRDLRIDSSVSVSNAVTVEGRIAHIDREQIVNLLMQLHPWRKGPFQFYDIFIDTEWRSNLKWDRLANSADFSGKTILDIGCGNGYYGWKMLAAGAKSVIGCDPMLLYNAQFELIRQFASNSCPHFLLPISDDEIPESLDHFDVTLSMGVLYHRTSPIDHLKKTCGTLKPGGQLILETLIDPASDQSIIVPADRYAKMRNVWFIPSIDMLERWLERTGFKDFKLIDVSTTSTDEQRQTEWMRFDSLSSFLDPIDKTKTIEGYPAPTRAIVSAHRR